MILPKLEFEHDPMKESVFHYTNVGTLQHVFSDIKSGNVKLRLTDVRFLNDPSESKLIEQNITKFRNIIYQKFNGDELKLVKAIVNIIPNFENKNDMPLPLIMVSSFTRCEDSLIFWNQGYAGLDGVSIKIKGSHLQKICSKNEFSYENVRYVNPGKFGDIFFDTIAKDIKGLIEYGANKIGTKEKLNEMAAVIWAIFHEKYSCLYKHTSWSHESETRLIRTFNCNRENIEQGLFSFMLGRNKKFKKYPDDAIIEFTEKQVRSHTYVSLAKESIQAINFGPKCNKAQIEVMENYLKRSNCEHVSVSKSMAPIR